MTRIFKDYTEVNEKLPEGFTVAKASIGINAEATGMMLELERQIDNVTIGVDVIYNPDHEKNDTPFMISNEYIKNIF